MRGYSRACGKGVESHASFRAQEIRASEEHVQVRLHPDHSVATALRRKVDRLEGNSIEPVAVQCCGVELPILLPTKEIAPKKSRLTSCGREQMLVLESLLGMRN